MMPREEAIPHRPVGLLGGAAFEGVLLFPLDFEDEVEMTVEAERGQESLGSYRSALVAVEDKAVLVLPVKWGI